MILASEMASPLNQTQMLVLVILLFSVFGPGMWCAVCMILSVTGGWRRLAQKYRTQDAPSGVKLGGQSGRMGWVNYNHVLTVWRSDEGLHLSVFPLFRLGHPPLFIPWKDIHGLRRKNILWVRNVAFEVGEPSLATVQLNEKVFEGRMPAE